MNGCVPGLSLIERLRLTQKWAVALTVLLFCGILENLVNQHKLSQLSVLPSFHFDFSFCFSCYHSDLYLHFDTCPLNVLNTARWFYLRTYSVQKTKWQSKLDIVKQDVDILVFFQQKSILSLRLLENGTLLSGGLDGKLAAWDANKYFNTPLQENQVSGN